MDGWGDNEFETHFMIENGRYMTISTDFFTAINSTMHLLMNRSDWGGVLLVGIDFIAVFYRPIVVGAVVVCSCIPCTRAGPQNSFFGTKRHVLRQPVERCGCGKSTSTTRRI
jgi:hypothetical protein